MLWKSLIRTSHTQKKKKKSIELVWEQNVEKTGVKNHKDLRIILYSDCLVSLSSHPTLKTPKLELMEDFNRM